jgi:hypothetical protein
MREKISLFLCLQFRRGNLHFSEFYDFANVSFIHLKGLFHEMDLTFEDMNSYTPLVTSRNDKKLAANIIKPTQTGIYRNK